MKEILLQIWLNQQQQMLQKSTVVNWFDDKIAILINFVNDKIHLFIAAERMLLGCICSVSHRRRQLHDKRWRLVICKQIGWQKLPRVVASLNCDFDESGGKL